MDINIKYQSRNLNLSFAICKGYHPVRLVSNNNISAVNAVNFASSPIISSKTVTGIEITDYTEETYPATWHGKTAEYVTATIKGLLHVGTTVTIPFTGEGDNEPHGKSLLVHCRIPSVELNPSHLSWIGAVDVPYICLAK